MPKFSSLLTTEIYAFISKPSEFPPFKQYEVWSLFFYWFPFQKILTCYWTILNAPQNCPGNYCPPSGLLLLLQNPTGPPNQLPVLPVGVCSLQAILPQLTRPHHPVWTIHVTTNDKECMVIRETIIHSTYCLTRVISSRLPWFATLA